MTEVLEAKVHLHRNGHWSLYMRLPDGSTESWRGLLDVWNVDSMFWQQLCAMASDSDSPAAVPETT